jgi:hypothetical protein
MATAMHLARLTSVSPSTFTDRADALKNDPRIVQLTKEKAGGGINKNQLFAIDKLLQERRESINVVFDAWENLGKFPDGHKNYRMVRKFYKDSAALIRALLDQNINRLNLEGDVNDPSTPKGKLMLSVRRMYEDSDFKGIDEYFPFMRHGEFVLEVAGPRGREVYHFDSAKKRTDHINKRARQLKVDPEDGNIFKVRTEKSGNEVRNQYAAESRMLTDMFKAVEEATKTPAVDREQLKDQLYQVYLTTLPEQSFRKHFLHSDNVTGFSDDVFRNFKISATRIASQAATLRYAPEIAEGIQRAKDTLEGMPPAQNAELNTFVDEMERRALAELNPQPESPWANGAAQFSFYMLLTGMGSAAIQTTALPLYVMPVLNAQYGYGNAAKSFAKWTTLFRSLGFKSEDVDGVRKMTAPTVGESSLVRNNPLFQRAFNEALARDILGQSLSSTVIDLRRTPNNAVDSLYANAGRSLLNISAGLFSGSERLTREISYMMAFDLAYKKSGDFDKSVEEAIEVVQTYIGRFDRFGRAPVTQGWGKVILQFKPYAALVTTFLIRNAIRVTGAYGKKEAWKAINILGGMLLMGSMFYGITGLPLYDVICDVIDALLDSLEEEEGWLNKAVKSVFGEEVAQQQVTDKLARVRKDPRTATNADMRFRYEFLPKWFGGITFGGEDGRKFSLAPMIERGPVSVLTDVNVGPRMSLNGMWFKPVRESQDLKETMSNYADALLSAPVSGAMERIVDGANDIANGKELKGAAQIVPAFYANPLKAELIRQEGVKNRRGDTIVSKDELSNVNLVAQITGIGSTRAAALQERNYKFNNEVVKAEKKKAKLLKDYDELITSSSKTPEERKKELTKWWNKFTQYNRRYPLPGLELTLESVEKSGKGALERAGMSVRGYRIKDTLAPYLLPQMREYTKQIMGEK